MTEEKTIPTVPLRLVYKKHMAYSGSARTILGSVIIHENKQGQLTYLKTATSSADTWFQISGMIGTILGTIDYNYLEAAGQEVQTGNIYEPLESFEAGTIIFQVLNPGSAQDYMLKARIDLV